MKHYLCFIFLETRAAEFDFKYNGLFAWADGCDFSGFDINANDPPKKSKEDCGASCARNSECDRFSWDTSENCYHKKQSGTVATAKAGARCGYIYIREFQKKSNYEWAYHCDYKGRDLPNRQYTMNNIEECGEKCFADSECDHFTWYNVNNVCYLKKGKSSWSNNVPSPLLNAQCGYIPARDDQIPGK